MKLLSGLAIIMLMLGCAVKPQENSVSVGMSGQQAESVLKTAEAKEVEMDMADETETDSINSTYDLPDGSVLVVSISKSENKVSNLDVCRNADLPKSKRTWKSVESVTLTKN